MEKVDDMQEQMGTVHGEGETLRNTQNEELAVKQMKNVLDGLISRLDMAKDSTSESKDMPEETPQLKPENKNEKGQGGERQDF